MSECEKCRDAHLHAATLIDNRCPGCRARMLSTLPTKAARQGWIDRWRAKGEIVMAKLVITKLQEMADANNSNG